MKIHSPLAVAALAALAGPVAAHIGEEQKLMGLDTAAGDQFGSAVSIHHETLVVGAPAASGTAGAAYVFVYDGDLWNEVAKLVHPTGGVAGDRFGTAVSVHEGLIVVGAPGRDDNGAESGAAYVYVDIAGVWTFQDTLLPSGAAIGDFFGRSVSLSETTAVVGAIQNQAGASGAGFASVFVQSGVTWGEEATLLASDGLAGDLFGYSVSISGEMAAVGAFNGDGVVANSGSAYIYSRTGTLWAEDDELFDAGGAAGDGFGSSLSLFIDANTLLAVGAPGDDDNGSNAGASTVFTKVPIGWLVREKNLGFSPTDRFGVSVSQSFRTTISGVWLDDDEGTNAGSAYAHTVLGVVPTTLQIYVATDAGVNDNLGRAVANHECWSAIGAPRNDELGIDAGAVYMFPVVEGATALINGTGINPVLMTTHAEPNIGAHWEIEVDCTGVAGAAASQIYAFNNFNTGTPIIFGIGELLLDTSSGLIFTDLVLGSGVNTHEIDIPANPWLIGIRPRIQAGIRSGAPGMPLLQLTNAEGAIIGCHGHHEEP